MANTSMNIRMDSDIKQKAQKIFAELGMDTTTAINIFLRQVIRTNGLPFEVKIDTPNAETIEALQEIEKLKEDSTKKTYSTFSELLKDVTDDV
ncbi:MAG: type II toxin-antitoxin system RelB/DinJ family antitoxin [Clostridia bacterium]|nr:type II toxin-antitoxin system RelB/DinJ family antitoxin [Clostridia bacterium]